MKNTETTTITLGVDTADELRIFKIKTQAKNLDQVIKLLIKTYRQYKKEVKGVTTINYD